MNKDIAELKRIHAAFGGFDPVETLKAMQKEAVETLNKLSEYQQKEKDGRLVELPCKIGRIVYFLNTGWVEPICGDVVTQISLDERGWFMLTENVGDTDIEPVCVAELGKARKNWGRHKVGVFLTREEAETALKEGAKQNDL